MIPLIATLIVAVILAQTMWILKLQGQIEDMRRTWRPRNDPGPLPSPYVMLPWPAETVTATTIEIEA